MPRGSEQARGSAPISRVLVALTGWGQEEDRKKTSAACFDLHLVKPVEFAVLRKLLADLPSAPLSS